MTPIEQRLYDLARQIEVHELAIRGLKAMGRAYPDDKEPDYRLECRSVPKKGYEGTHRQEDNRRVLYSTGVHTDH